MEQKALQDIFLQILAAELNGTGIDEETTAMLTADPSSFRGLYDLSKKHDLAHIVASALQKAGVQMPPEVQSKFQKADFLSVYRLEQMKYAFTQICETLEAAKIPYIPLKGAILRPFYPEERMRTSCDIDILVREENLDAAVNSLAAVGYIFEKRAYHDVSLHSPEGIHLELHFSIQENSERLDRVLSRAWDYAVPAEGFRYEFAPGFFVFHQLAHMSYHFTRGGCGVRPLMDLWVMRHRMNLDFTNARNLLNEADLWPFSEEITRLVEVCFSSAVEDDFTAVLLDYILNGGVYGNAKNQIAMQKHRRGGTFRYVMYRAFPPYKIMKEVYPILRKVPILLPFCWIVRAFAILFSPRARRAAAELKTARAVTDEQTVAMRCLQERLHL